MSSAVGVANIMFLVALAAFVVVGMASFWLTERDSERVRRAAIGIATLGLAAMVVFMIEITLRLNRAPWGSLYEFVAVLSAIVMGVVAYVLIPRRDFAMVAGFLSLVVSALMLIVRISAFTTPTLLQPALQSGWLVIHVFMAVIGSALLLAVGVISALYLVRKRWEDRNPTWSLAETSTTASDARESEVPEPALAGRPSGPGAALATSVQKRGFGGRLASSERLDNMARMVTLVAFPIWTVAIILGAIWGEQAWGRYWGWDPKETVSFMVWATFAAYLHARATATWKGRRAAVLGVVGGGLILFNLFGINFLIEGLHSYSGG